MFDYEKISDEVASYLGGWYQDFDVPEIMAALREYTTENGDHISSITDVDFDDFIEILRAHEK